MAKYNDKSRYFKDWTTEKLKEEVKVYDQLIHVVCCYGVRDCIAYYGMLDELDKREVEYDFAIEFKD